MKNRKKIAILYVLFFLFFNFIRPKVIIHSPENTSTEISAVMDVFDKEYNEDVSIWYVNKIKNSTSDYSLLNKETVIINYPLLYDIKGSKNFIIMYYMGKNEDELKSLHRFFVNAGLLYFWRIEVFLQDNGEIQKSYMYKYPWSHKQFFNISES